MMTWLVSTSSSKSYEHLDLTLRSMFNFFFKDKSRHCDQLLTTIMF